MGGTSAGDGYRTIVVRFGHDKMEQCTYLLHLSVLGRRTKSFECSLGFLQAFAHRRRVRLGFVRIRTGFLECFLPQKSRCPVRTVTPQSGM